MGNDDITWFHGCCKVMAFFSHSFAEVVFCYLWNRSWTDVNKHLRLSSLALDLNKRRTHTDTHINLPIFHLLFIYHGILTLSFLICSVRVANELGRGSSKAAKFSIVVTVLTSFAIGFILFLLFLFLREKLAYIFTTNKDVADAVGDLSPLLAISILLNSVQPVLSGILKQHLASKLV